MATFKEYKSLLTHIERLQASLNEVKRYAEKFEVAKKGEVKEPSKKRGRKKKSQA